MYVCALTVQRPELALWDRVKLPTLEQLKPLCSSSVLLLLRNVSVMLTWLLAASVTAVRIACSVPRAACLIPAPPCSWMGLGLRLRGRLDSRPAKMLQLSRPAPSPALPRISCLVLS